MSDTFTARIVDWNSEKGFGFVQAGPRRVFIHIRDFAERHKRPEVGDVIRFSLGTDAQGRPCATNAVHHNDGGRFRPRDLLFLLILLCAPGLALHRLALDPRLLLVSAFAISLVTYLFYASDKMRAREQDWRIPESLLHLLEIAGGWPGAFIAQRRLRHKVSKVGYQIVFWLIVCANEHVAFDYLLDGEISRKSWEVWCRLAEHLMR